MDCSYYSTQDDHCESLLQPWFLLEILGHLKWLWVNSGLFFSSSCTYSCFTFAAQYAYVCMWRPEWNWGGIRECNQVSYRCHASTVQKIYLLIFVITEVITKKTNVLFIRKLNVRGLYPPPWLASCHCILDYQSTLMFLGKEKTVKIMNSRGQVKWLAHILTHASHLKTLIISIWLDASQKSLTPYGLSVDLDKHTFTGEESEMYNWIWAK